MTVKTVFSKSDFEEVLAHYQLGVLNFAEPVAQGTVPTNYFIITNEGKFVFRYYENRSRFSALFEIEVLRFLQTHQFGKWVTS